MKIMKWDEYEHKFSRCVGHKGYKEPVRSGSRLVYLDLPSFLTDENIRSPVSQELLEKVESTHVRRGAAHLKGSVCGAWDAYKEQFQKQLGREVTKRRIQFQTRKDDPIIWDRLPEVQYASWEAFVSDNGLETKAYEALGTVNRCILKECRLQPADAKWPSIWEDTKYKAWKALEGTKKLSSRAWKDPRKLSGEAFEGAKNLWKRGSSWLSRKSTMRRLAE